MVRAYVLIKIEPGRIRRHRRPAARSAQRGACRRRHRTRRPDRPGERPRSRARRRPHLPLDPDHRRCQGDRYPHRRHWRLIQFLCRATRSAAWPLGPLISILRHPGAALVRILVSGGAGFIASHVSDRFLELGHEVAIVDNLVTGKRENLPSSAAFYEVDIVTPALDDVFAEVKPEVVCHHAAHIDVRRSVADPMYDAQVNVLGSLNLLECCRRHGTRKVIYAGTGGALFGEAEYMPVDETHPVDPDLALRCQQAHGRALPLHLPVNFGLDYTVLRYPNVYGPRQDPHGEAGVVAIFALQLLAGTSPPSSATAPRPATTATWPTSLPANAGPRIGRRRPVQHRPRHRGLRPGDLRRGARRRGRGRRAGIRPRPAR